MLISILTGFAAGALHVVSGADHLVSIAPSSIGKPASALRNGLTWGVGHSTGVLILSSIAILVKDLAPLERMSSFAELSVGIALLVIGALAIRTSLGLSIHSHSHQHVNGHAHNHVHLHLFGREIHSRHPHAVTSLGILHGLAGGTHVLAVLPALALPPIWAIVYMSAYLIGSIMAMSVFVLAISFATLKVGRKSLPLMFGFTGGASVVTGLFWLQRTSMQIF